MFTAQIFQFHKGTIKTFVSTSTNCCRYEYFNSIKVRLKPQYRFEVNAPQLFQFHKGTIKTLPAQRSIAEMTIFQFHKGTIKTLLTLRGSVLRLLFQFHKGTIKTIWNVLLR